jgi:hypothetical protein
VAQHTIIVESASQPAAQRKRRKAPLILAGIGLIALVPVIGSTFAANIGIGSGNIEFGQGSQRTVSCDDSVTVTPAARFIPGSGATADSWDLSIDVTDINADYCEGKTFTVTTWGGAGDANSSQDTWVFTLTGSSGEAGVGSTGSGTYTKTGPAYSLALSYPTAMSDAAQLKTITIESSN